MNCPFHFNKGPSFWNWIRSVLFKKSKSFLSVENLQAILLNAVEAIITINEESTIVLFSRTAEVMFGYSQQEVLGRNVNYLMPEPFHSEHDHYVQHYLATGEKKIIGIGREVKARRKDGIIFPIDLAVSEVIVGNTRLFTAFIRDLTKAKEAEQVKEESIVAHAQLKAQNEYVSILGHELRTPLTSMKGSLKLLMDEKLNSHQAELLAIANRTSDRLEKIVADVLDIARIQMGILKIEKKPISVTQAATEAIDTLRPIAEKKGLQLIQEGFDVDFWSMSDAERVIQVMVNLLNNGIKYSNPKGKIWIRIERRDHQIRVSVQDQGKGVAESVKKRMFTPFNKDESGIGTGGVGLGLFICKGIITQLGGTIDFSSTPNQGSTFYFEIPELERMG